MSTLPKSWFETEIEQVLQPLGNGKFIQQGWSPQCEKVPATLEQWGVLKTTAIQEGYFLPEENKRLPEHLEPRPAIEIKPGDILMTCAGPRNRCGVTSFVREARPRLLMSGKMYRIRADPVKIDPKYLEFFLLSQDAKAAIDRMKTGINDSGLNLTHDRFSKLRIPLAPLNEQKRIVGKIEELFTELDNALKCLSVAQESQKALYHSVLDHAFARCKEQKNLASLISQKLSNGYSGKPVAYETRYKVLSLSATTSGVFLDSHFKFLDEKQLDERDIWCSPGDILIQRGNTAEYVGVPAIYTGKPHAFIFPDLMIRVRADESIVSMKYLYYALSSPRVRNILRRKAKGSAGTMPKISQAILNSLPIPYCPRSEQDAVVARIEEQISNCLAVEDIIQAGIAKSHVLRKSILKRAFSGRLAVQDDNDEPASVLLARIKAERVSQTGMEKQHRPQKVQSKAAPSRTNVIPFPVKLANISTTDLHAGILARAYQHHENAPKYLAYFGHVKAEKIAHLVEAHLGIDLGREPVKAAAGPNDYPHLKKIESRAQKSNWFTVRQKKGGGGYVFTQGSGFDDLLLKTQLALGDQATAVDELISILLPLNTRQAEIVATLYAAWNNLLLLGRAPNDEEIVYEARENWHASKLEIEREKFFKGLEWMRQKGLVPEGRGRYVDVKSKNKTTRKPS